MNWVTLRHISRYLGLAVMVAYAASAGLMGSPILDAPAAAQLQGMVPGNALGNLNDAEMWRQVRRGVSGTVSIPDKKAGVLVQAEGDIWRSFRNGPLTAWGGWLLLASVVVIALFFALRGRIRIDAGPSGRTVERFNSFERFTHWLAASSFIVLALSGLNTLYGKFVLLPVLGPSAFSTLSMWGKLAHNYISFAFIAGIVLMFVAWVRDNLLSGEDFNWMVKGGGLFVKGVHPPAKKFNLGQKVIFWVVILGGGSVAFTGICMLFPFQLAPFAPTFALLNFFGFDLPVTLTALQEMQLAQLWHSMLSVVLIAIIIAHIYIGSLGMEGAFSAVSTGQVDENWAREHHSLWVEEMTNETASAEHGQPAE